MRKILRNNSDILGSNDLCSTRAFRKQTNRAITVALRDVSFSAFLLLKSDRNGRLTEGSSVSARRCGCRSFLALALPTSNACRI